MWKAVVLVSFASVVLQQARAQGGAESLPFHGYVPWENIMGSQPEGDGQPNDIYSHIEQALTPQLGEDEVVFYPRNLAGFGIEYGQDPEEHVYRIHTADEVAKLAQKKHDKHDKHAHDHLHQKGSKDSAKGKDFGRPHTTATNTPSQRPDQPNLFSEGPSPNYSYSSPPDGSSYINPSDSFSQPPRPSNNRNAPYPYRFPPPLPQ